MHVLTPLRALTVDVLAQQPSPFPAPGQEGDIIEVTLVKPPNSDKLTTLLGVGLWAATAVLIGLGMWAGVKFAQAFADGSAGRGEKFMVVGVAVGSVITASAASYVTFFMK